MTPNPPRPTEHAEQQCNCGADGTAAEVEEHVRRMNQLPHNVDSDYHGIERPQHAPSGEPVVAGLVRNDVELRAEIRRLNGVIHEYAVNLATQDREVARLRAELAQRPIEHAEQQRCLCHYDIATDPQAERHTNPRCPKYAPPQHAPVADIDGQRDKWAQHTPSGEQPHGPTSHGPEFWSSNCQQPACIAYRLCGSSATQVCVKASGHDGLCSYNDANVEIRGLRAELAQRTAEIERLRASANEAEELDVQGNLRAVALEDENDRLRAELAQVWQQRDQYLAELEQARAVVLAARKAKNFSFTAARLNEDLADALAALDHSPAVGEMQNRL